MRYLVTGTAGFIGFHLARRLLADGHSVTGFDGFTPYYDVSLKEARHALLERSEAFTPVRGMLEDADALKRAADRAQPDVIIHLAAQAGVRHSIDHPDSYIDANIRGTFNVLELARRVSPAHLLIASTSSVYGANHNPPFTETDESAQPLSLYAATKKAGEVMAHSYAHLFRVPTTCFRFFTVYGPWGRPDMALFKFVRAILAGEPIEIYGHGQMRRDFTYVDDLVEAILLLADRTPAIGQPVLTPGITDTLSPEAAFRIVNIGGEQPVDLLDFIDVIERAVGRQAQKIMRPMQAGDVPLTVASPRLLEALTGYKPATTVETGVAAFVAWYRDYFRV